MKKSVLVLAIVAAFAPVFAQAEAGDFVVRVRAVNVSPNEDSKLGKTINNAGLIDAGAKLAVDDNWIPELDISYYLTKNIAAELILALGTEHDVNIKNASTAGAVHSQKLGSVDLLPPTLTVQWHFNPDQTFDPYVGAGVNYTYMLDRKLSLSQGEPGAKIKIDSDSWGWVAQAGFDINLKDGWLINADVKYVTIDTDVKLKGATTGDVWTKIDSLDINPWVFGVGIGKKF